MSRLLLPKVIGHRGAKAYAPENTRASLHAAADLGLTWVEIDVKLTKDGIAIIFHDDELDRCTNATGKVADTPWDVIKELDAGSWFGDSFMGEPVPLLEDALDVIFQRNLSVNLEIKPCPGREVETAEVMLDIATRLWPDDMPPPLLSSFQPVSLETAQDMIEDWPRGLLLDEVEDGWNDLAAHLEASTININGNTVTADQLDDILRASKPVLAYTINDPDKARELIAAGVTGLFADNPDVIRDAVETRH